MNLMVSSDIIIFKYSILPGFMHFGSWCNKLHRPLGKTHTQIFLLFSFHFCFVATSCGWLVPAEKEHWYSAFHKQVAYTFLGLHLMHYSSLTLSWYFLSVCPSFSRAPHLFSLPDIFEIVTSKLPKYSDRPYFHTLHHVGFHCWSCFKS